MTTLRGTQKPTFEWRSGARSSAGAQVCRFMKSAHVLMDPWQGHVLDGALAENPDGTWACNEVCLIVGRQNGKGGVIEARELAGIYLFDETLILHSAHQQRTSNDAFLRMVRLIQSTMDLDEAITQIARSKGEESISFRIKHEEKSDRCKRCAYLDTNSHEAKIRYMARSSGAGRGFTKSDLVVLDEAMILDDPPIAALLPTMATQPNWQVWYTASQGDRKLPTESRVLGKIRRRGFRKEPGLYMAEWSAHLKHGDLYGKPCELAEEHPLDNRSDPATWAKTNPAMGEIKDGGRIAESFLRKMIVGGGMSAWDADREFLGVGDYPSEEGWSVVSEEVWASFFDKDSKISGGFVVGIDVSWDQRTTSVAVAGKRDDGLWHWQLLKLAEAGTSWVVAYLEGLKKQRPVAYVMDARCPLVEEVRAAVGEKRLLVPKPAEWAQWCAKTLQILTETQDVRHLGQEPLTNALKYVEKKDYPNGVFVWKREEPLSDVTPWMAVTLALGGAVVKGTKKRTVPLVGAGAANAAQHV